MDIFCTNCGFLIDPKLANVRTDLIQCPECHKIHSLSKLIKAANEPLPEKEQHNFKTEKTYLTDEKTSFFDDFPSDRNLISTDDFELNDFDEPPHGSKIDFFATRSMLEINIPSRRMTVLDIFPLFFSLIWLGFVTFWTVMAAWGAGPFALFSIPFWIVGISMASGALSGLFEKQTIEVDRYVLRVSKQGIFRTKTQEFDIQDITAIKMKGASFKNSFRSMGRMGQQMNKNTNASNNDLLTIIAGVKEMTVFEFVSDAETEWGLRTLKKAIRKIGEKNL